MLLMVAAALAMKALVPVGYMVLPSASSFTVSVCSGMTGEQMTVTIPIKQQDSGKTAVDKQMCHASALDAGALGGTDPFLLGSALAFILALGFAPVSVPLRRAARYLLPPLRGPPTTI